MRIYFIGIGGIGVSALAQYYLAKGHKVSGSDLVSSEITRFLQKKSIKIIIGSGKSRRLGRSQNFIKGSDLIIYSPAVPKDHPELKLAKKLKIRCLSYPEALGELTKKYFTIAVCGSHGKSTTASMLGLILIKANLDPTVIVGTRLKEFGNSNFRLGKGRYLVIEADEYKDSFLNYWPKMIVLTNIDKDHLDYFRSFENLILSFEKFVGHLPANGWLVVNKDNRLFRDQNLRSKVQYFSSRQKRDIQRIRKVLKIPGRHNILNALAALTAARLLGVSDKTCFEALAEYNGSWRRFEILKESPFVLVSDYAHHPSEVLATLRAAREKFGNKEIWCFFQPHQYQRTYYLWDDFVRSLREAPADRLFITDIYDVPGREDRKINRAVSSKRLVKAVNREGVIYIKRKDILPFLKEKLNRGKVVIIMGAGDIYNLAEEIKKW